MGSNEAGATMVWTELVATRPSDDEANAERLHRLGGRAWRTCGVCKLRDAQATTPEDRRLP